MLFFFPQKKSKKPEGTSINSIDTFNHDAVTKHFDNQMLNMEKHRLVERRTINVDKTGIYTV